MARANRWMKHGRTVGRLVMIHYGNPSRTYYYPDGLFAYLRLIKSEHNKQEVCLITVNNNNGTLIIAVVVDGFLVIGSS